MRKFATGAGPQLFSRSLPIVCCGDLARLTASDTKSSRKKLRKRGLHTRVQSSTSPTATPALAQQVADDDAEPKDPSADPQAHSFRVDFDDLASTKGKVRLDSYLCTRLEDASRAKIQTSIKDGLVTVNGRPLQKAAHAIKFGDIISCRLAPPRPLEAEPQDIPLEIVYEDEHLLIVNKAAGMVVHPSPGHYDGTLVNALLHHCGLPAMQLAIGAMPPLSLSGETDDQAIEADEDVVDEILSFQPLPSNQQPVIRPGIVHRLDKDTSGLLVVAKDDKTHAGLCDQFKEHTVERSYLAITIGIPKQSKGVIETNVGRDLNDRKKMAPFGFNSSRGRHAVSRFQVVEQLAGGRAALVQWRLQTGRTHQIRVHARHAGFPIFGDESYGGSSASAVSFIGGKTLARQQIVRNLSDGLARQALHAQTLGFEHPATKAQMRFTSELPADFSGVLEQLRSLQ